MAAIRVPANVLVTMVTVWMFCLHVVTEAEHMCIVTTIFGLKTADCDRKNLKTVPKNLSHDIKVLTFKENHLTYLGIDEFKVYVSLQEIYLVRNRIEIMAPDAFRGLYNLQILDLEGNKLSEVPSDVFRHIRSVRILKLKSNQIRWISNSAFKNLPNIEELNFENCWLERIDSMAFQGLSKLNEINLVNNELTSLGQDMRTALPASLVVFRLYRNPWICDCKMRWLREWLASNKINWDFSLNTPACSGPELIRSINWEQLSAAQFACASRIVENSTTSIELQVGGNVTILCVVYGDPEPKVIWKKGDHYLSKDAVSEEYKMASSGQMQIKSSLFLDELDEQDTGDYKCIAENPAGRSEVTYKLWMEEESKPAQVITIFGLSKAATIGIVVVAIIVGLLLISFAVCLYRKTGGNNSNRSYKVRKPYKKANDAAKNTAAVSAAQKGGGGGGGGYGVDIVDEDSEIKEKERTAVVEAVAVAHTELLLAKETAVKPSTQQANTVTANHHPETEKLHNHLNHNNTSKPGEFKMKIFTAAFEDDKDTRRTQNEQLSPDRDGHRTTEAEATSPNDNRNHIREATPDLLCDDKHTRSNHKTPTPPPPPAAYYANHIAAAQKRAEENPYAKPSELKSGGQKTPESSETLLDYTKGLEKAGKPNVKTASRESCGPPGGKPSSTSSPKLSKEPSSKDHRHKSDCKDNHSCSSTAGTPCTNPVCMKAHGGRSKPFSGAPPVSGRGHKPHISSSHSVGSMSDLDGMDIDSPERKSGGSKVNGGSRHQGGSDSDRYKTLPCRGAGKCSPSRKLPLTPGQSSLQGSPTGGALMQAEKGPVSRPRVQFASPVRDSPSSSLSSTPTSPRLQSSGSGGGKGAGPWATMGRQPTNPLHPKGLKVMSPEGPRTLTFPGAIEPLTAPNAGPAQASSKPTRTYGCSTSIDDLLSPPFGYVGGGQQQQQQQQHPPRPGHKDEYGTAV